MNTDLIINMILKDTYTLNKLRTRLPMLKEYLIAHFFGTTDDFYKNHIDAEIEWLKTFDNQFLENFTKENLYQNLDEIQKKLDQIKPLVIYIPITIPASEAILMGQKLRADFNKNFLYEIKYDPNLIAGCALVWNGIYKDYSIRANIQTRKLDILSSFKRYLNK